MTLELKNDWKLFGGSQKVFSHDSETLACKMEFSVFLPSSSSSDQRFPVLYYLSGLTCTWENAITKAGAQQFAEEVGVILVFPDTSPRGENVPDEADNYAFGKGAGFYLNATQDPWEKNFRMYDYIVNELRKIINEEFPADLERTGITGHSMGGHGALTIAMKNPDVYTSVSAFAPIVSPMSVSWGQSAFSGYLGKNYSQWENYDACRLVKSKGWNRQILVDQGGADNFLGKELQPEDFVSACKEAGVDLTMRIQGGYDHSYYFISSFMEDHIRWHAKRLYF